MADLRLSRALFLILAILWAGPSAAATWGAATLVEEVRVGRLDGPDEYIFGAIAHIAVGSSGMIYAYDGQLESIRMYDADGVYQGAVGRRGQGPGEFNQVIGMEVLPDGRLAVLHVSPHTVTLFTSAGKYHDVYTVPSQLHAPRMFDVDMAGHLYVKAVQPRPAGAGEWDFWLLKLSAQGRLLDRIPVPKENRKPDCGIIYTSDGPYRYFSVATRHAWSPLGYFIVGRNDDYAFEIRAGEVPISVIRPFEAVAVKKEERAQWKGWNDYSDKRANAQGMKPTGATALPESKPAYKDIYVGDDGRIWIHRHAAAVERDLPPRAEGDDRPLIRWREPITFDVFEPDGSFLGSVVLPWDTLAYVFRDRHMWAVQTGAAGAQIVRFRVEPEGNKQQ
jgi:hypothetical protein